MTCIFLDNVSEEHNSIFIKDKRMLVGLFPVNTLCNNCRDCKEYVYIQTLFE